MKTRILIILMISLWILPLHAQESGSGQIAIMAQDGNIILYDVATQAFTPVTTDASLQDPIKVYQWGTWASDGQLAFFGTNADPDNVYTMGVFVRRPDGKVKGVYATDQEAFTYAHWSPGDCTDGGAFCRDLAILVTQANGGLALRMVHAADDFSNEIIAEGGPFYWDWSPDGQAMFWARFGRTLEIYNAANHTLSEPLPFRQGQQQSVDWSPVDNRLLTTLLGNTGTSSLVVINGEETQNLVDGLEGGVAFEWSPNGEMVGYTDNREGDLHIINGASGAEVANPTQGALAFFWSPDSKQVAYLTFNAGDRPGASLFDSLSAEHPRMNALQQGAPELNWQVYNIETGANTYLATFVPSAEMIYYLTFYDQFMRSHRLWSPDSRYIVFGETNQNGDDVVSLIDLQLAGVQVLTEGSMGVFSWQ